MRGKLRSARKRSDGGTILFCREHAHVLRFFLRK